MEFNQNQTKKFFLYARKSTEEEERQALSIPAQITELREFASKENLEIVDLFTETKTAKEPGREVFNRMLEGVKNGEASGILSWHPDRLARNAVDAGKIIHLLDTGKLTSLKFPTFWFENTPQGLFMLSLAFGQSKYYSDSLSENTKRGLRQKVRRGEYPSLAPIGYLNDIRNKTIVVDPQTALIVKKAFRLYSRGIYTLEDISSFFAQKRVLSKRGRHIRKDRVKYILTNPFYYGHFKYAGEVHEGKHKPIIKKKLFDKVQAVIKRRGHARPRKSHHFPFAGFIRCGECGFTITAEKKIKHYKTVNRTQTFVYYRCSKKSKTQKCFQPFVRQESLIPQVNHLVQKVSLRKDWGEKMLARLDREEKEASQSLTVFVQEIKDEISSVNQKLQFLLDSYLEQIITREEYLKKKSELMSQKKSLEEKIIDLNKNRNDWLGPMRSWVLSALEAEKIASSADLEEKARFLQNLGSDLVLTDQKLDSDLSKPWFFLASPAPSRNWERVMGFAPTAFCLGSRRSATELHPRLYQELAFSFFQIILNHLKKARVYFFIAVGVFFAFSFIFNPGGFLAPPPDKLGED